MLPSERIRRGFFRIGLVGAAVAAVISVVSLGLAAYERASPGWLDPKEIHQELVPGRPATIRSNLSKT